MNVRPMLGSVQRLLRLGGLDPLAARHLRHLPRYIRDLREFKRQGGVIDKYVPQLADFADTSGVASGHYFHQDLLIAQRIYAAAPSNHIDVGSRIDGFVAHVAAFRPIEVLDIRPLASSSHPNIRFVQADLMAPIPSLREKYSSVSCLHALEHFGLGRYTDPVDVRGHRRGFEPIAALVAPHGKLYLSVPVGRRRVEFNAHRVADPRDPLDWAKDIFELEAFDLVDDEGELRRDAALEEAAALYYGCGIYTFAKWGV